MINRQAILNRILNKESLSGIIGSTLSLYLLINLDKIIEIGSITTFSSQSLPKVLLWIILSCSLILILQGIINSKHIETTIDRAVVKKGLGYILYCGVFYLYLILLPIIGFMISTCMLTSAILINYKQKKWLNYMIIFSIIIIINFLFKFFLYVYLPSSTLWGGM